MATTQGAILHRRGVAARSEDDTSASVYSILYGFGRTLIALIFVLSGIAKIFSWDQTLQYMGGSGMIATPFFLVLAIAIEVGAGLALMFGAFTRWAALLIFLYLIPVTLIFHNFWALEGMEAQMQQTHFLKNLAIMGGLLAYYLLSLHREKYNGLAPAGTVSEVTTPL